MINFKASESYIVIAIAAIVDVRQQLWDSIDRNYG
jgi:hypothetical protein